MGVDRIDQLLERALELLIQRLEAEGSQPRNGLSDPIKLSLPPTKPPNTDAMDFQLRKLGAYSEEELGEMDSESKELTLEVLGRGGSRIQKFDESKWKRK